MDKFSKIDISNSDVEGNYDGEGNFDKEPSFTDTFTNSDEYASMKFKTGGDSGILEQYLGIRIDEGPVGLVYELK